MASKKCTGCNTVKPLEEFCSNRSKPDGRSYRCKPCTATATRAYYRKNEEARKDYTIKRIKAHQEYVKQWKAERGCEKCGLREVVCLDVHHIDPSQKEFTVSHMCTGGRSLEFIKKELEQCTVLCANCHRREHWATDPGGQKGASSKPKSKPGPKVDY